MEKSSQKLIRETSPLKNRFRDMLSEVHIKLPSTLEAKQKPHNLVLEIQSYFDRSGQNLIEGRLDQQDLQKKNENNQNGRKKLGDFIINVPLKTKNSSLNKEHAIIQRFLCLVEEKMQVIQECQKDFENNQNQLLKDGFKCIKNYYTSQNYTFINKQSIRQEQKVPMMVNILVKMEEIRLKICFQKLIQFYRDSVLFGLSNTIADLKDNSLLKLQSQSRYLGLQTGKHLKQAPKIEKQFSEMNMSKKISSQYCSESLSALILNHNQLKISPELHQIYPNIPKSNKTINDKLTVSKKQIAELQLQTKKKIESSKKLTDSKDLPLDSRKYINDTNQEKVQNQIAVNNQEKSPSRPITFTYILKNLDVNGLQYSRESVNSKKMTNDDVQKWNAIHGTLGPESQFHNRNRNVFIQENRLQPQKRSVSLQIKPLQGLFISPSKPEKPNYQGNSNRIYNNQYYKQENCNRQNLIRPKCNFIDPVQTKPRAKSAAPRVTFNFCSSTNPPSSPIVHNKVRVQQERKIKYQEPDFIIQRSLIHDRNIHLAQSGKKEKQPKQNRLQIISPSSRRDSKNAARKLKTQQKESIKQRLLPPAFNDYYLEHNEPENKLRIPILSNSNFSTQPTHSQQKQIKKGNFKQIKKDFVNQVYFYEIEKPKQVGCQATFCNKAQLHNTPKINHSKEKILVTYNKNKS